MSEVRELKSIYVTSGLKLMYSNPENLYKKTVLKNVMKFCLDRLVEISMEDLRRRGGSKKRRFADVYFKKVDDELRAKARASLGKSRRSL